MIQQTRKYEIVANIDDRVTHIRVDPPMMFEPPKHEGGAAGASLPGSKPRFMLHDNIVAVWVPRSEHAAYGKVVLHAAEHLDSDNQTPGGASLAYGGFGSYVVDGLHDTSIMDVMSRFGYESNV